MRYALRRKLGILGSLLVGATQGCNSYLDVTGAQQDVIETAELHLDDELGDKHPEYDPNRTIVEDFEGCLVTLNKSASVTRLTLVSPEEELSSVEGTLYPNRGTALEALKGHPIIPSMEVINGAAKPFNDGLYAAVELLAESGAEGALVNKRATFNAMLAQMVSRLSEDEGTTEMVADFAAAATLRGQEVPSLPTAVQAAVTKELAAFDEKVLISTPMGFYTWNDQLSAIFRSDRFLMYSEPSQIAIQAGVGLLQDDPTLQADYRGILNLYQGLTNPFMADSPLSVLDFAASGTSGDAASLTAAFAVEHQRQSDADCAPRNYAWMPASRSPDTDYLSCYEGESTNLLDVLIQGIKSGKLDLTPRADSGWYDRQLYALETLLLPERADENDHLLLTAEYKEKLVETFKSLLTQTRETHAKQLGMAATKASAGPIVIDLYPQLPVEPFPTFYLRTARAYAFVTTFLMAALGEQALGATGRLLATGERDPRSLSQELLEKTELFYGLHLIATASIGMADGLSVEERSTVDMGGAEKRARDFVETWQTDADVLTDPRVVVQVAFDADARTATYFATIGVRVLRMHASYPEGFAPEVVAADFCEVEDIAAYQPYLLVEKTVSFATSLDAPPLTRDEFRAICDNHDSAEGIVAELEGR